MSTATIDRQRTGGIPSQASARPAKTERDARLDFFRGLSLFIIFISHAPGNPWNQYIPGKFGFSDATEVFVFCSGMASSLAFARVFDTHGAGIGTARIAHRCWQVYWAHICCFMVVIALMIAADRLFDTDDRFLRLIGLNGFLEQQHGARLLGLMTLTYVPPYFDILPMYLVILALLPPMMLLSRIQPALVMLASLALWAVASHGSLELPRDPLKSESWFFNPFSWQLVFFAGFAIKRRWIATPRANPILIAVSLALVILGIILTWKPLLDSSPELSNAHAALAAVIDKTHEGPLRLAHFLALAYLMSLAAGPDGNRLTGPLSRLTQMIGRQSLACFMTGLSLSFIAGVALAVTGRDNLLVVAAVNLSGLALLTLSAVVVTWFKSHPWRRKA